MTTTEASGGLPRRIRDFFHAEETPYGLALIRITMPLALLVGVIPRWPYAREIYSLDGAPAPLWDTYGMAEGLPLPTAPVAVALFSALVFFLLATSAGWMTRLSTILSFVLYTYFGCLDQLSTMTKYTCIAAHVLLILSLSHCGAVWSVDAWLRARSGDLPKELPKFPAWPRRLLQLLLGIIYLAAAMTKFHTPAFFSGDQLVFWMLTDVNFDNPLGERLALYPALVPIMSYLTVVWEVGFLFAAWRGFGRTCMLGIGVVFHFLTWATLGLIVFPLIYLTIYFSFVNSHDVDRISSWWRARRPESLRTRTLPASFRVRPLQSAAAFAVLAAATTFVGVELEYRLDRFGERRAEGAYALTPMEPERVATLLRNDQFVRPADKVMAFDLGSITVGDIVADRRRAFDYGETAIVQCSLLPPHEDIWVEFNLQDADGRVVTRSGQITPREYLRSSHHYTFEPDLAPGRYAWVLRIDGKDVARRDFTLGNQVQTVSAEIDAAR